MWWGKVVAVPGDDCLKSKAVGNFCGGDARFSARVFVAVCDKMSLVRLEGWFTDYRYR